LFFDFGSPGQEYNEDGIEVQWSEDLLDEEARDDLEEEIEEEEMDVSESGCRSASAAAEIVTANDSCQDEDDDQEEGEDEEGEEEDCEQDEEAAAHGEGVDDGVEIDERQVKDQQQHEEGEGEEDDDEDEEETTWVVGEEGDEEDEEELDDEEIREIRAKMMSSASPTASVSPSSPGELSCTSSPSPLDMRKAERGEKVTGCSGRRRAAMKTTAAAAGVTPRRTGKAGDRNLRNGMKSVHTSASSDRRQSPPASAQSASSSCSLQNGSSPSSSCTHSSGVKRNNCISKKSLSFAPSFPATASSNMTSSSSLDATAAAGSSGKAIDLSPDSKIRTRDQIVAAFSALNGRNIRSCNNNSSISPRSSSFGYNNGHSNLMMLDEDDDDEDEEEGDQMPGSKGESNGSYDPERLKAFNVI
jgi:hypothetical protein